MSFQEVLMCRFITSTGAARVAVDTP